MDFATQIRVQEASKTPHMYVGLDIDINVAPVESPADAKRYCSRVETCVGYAGNMIYMGDDINITAGNTRVYIKDPFSPSIMCLY